MQIYYDAPSLPAASAHIFFYFGTRKSLRQQQNTATLSSPVSASDVHNKKIVYAQGKFQFACPPPPTTPPPPPSPYFLLKDGTE